MLKNYIQLTFDARLGLMDENGERATSRPQPMARPVRMDIGGASPEHVRDLVEQLLTVAGLEREQRIELLGLALVEEAVRPFWDGEHTADQAHDALKSEDPGLAEAVEALAPILYGRAAVSAVEELLGL
jgi:hypothetical protein